MRRHLIAAAIFLLTGAVVNVAVAWCLAVSVNPLLGEREDSRTDNGVMCRLNRAGVAVTTMHRVRDTNQVAEKGVEPARVPVVAAAGWPLICSRYEYSFLVGGVSPIEDGLELGLDPWSGPSPFGAGFWPRALPLRPIWSGLAINTLSYAVLFWLLIAVLSALRRFVRARRGLCPNCAYPIRESAVCSECGQALPQCAVA